MKKIGFIGVGVMGKSMVRNLMKAGYELSIYTRTKEKVLDIIEEGAVWCDTVAQCVRDREAVITMVGYPEDVWGVYFWRGPESWQKCPEPGKPYVIDMTTTSPKLSVEIYERARDAGIYAVDAPVSGGDVGARHGTLSIMAGGDEEAFEACLELFKSMGKTIIYEGKAGNGQHTKAANQIALGGVIAGVCEAITYARAAGLDVQTMLDSISQGAAGSWQMNNMAPRMIKEDYDPGFFIKHYIKDMKIALEESDARKLTLPILMEVLDMYKKLDEKGLGDLGTQALIKIL